MRAQAEYDARFAALEERSAAQAQRERQVDTADELTRLGPPGCPVAHRRHGRGVPRPGGGV